MAEELWNAFKIFLNPVKAIVGIVLVVFTVIILRRIFRDKKPHLSKGGHRDFYKNFQKNCN